MKLACLKPECGLPRLFKLRGARAFVWAYCFCTSFYVARFLGLYESPVVTPAKTVMRTSAACCATAHDTRIAWCSFYLVPRSLLCRNPTTLLAAPPYMRLHISTLLARSRACTSLASTLQVLLLLNNLLASTCMVSSLSDYRKMFWVGRWLSGYSWAALLVRDCHGLAP